MVRAMSLPRTVEISAVHFEANVKTSYDVEELLTHVRTQSKKRFVSTVEATFHLGEGLDVTIEVQERGARMRVAGRGIYAFSLDGLMSAAADIIREEHASDPALLDVLQELLGLG